MQKSKDSLKACFENVNIYKCMFGIIGGKNKNSQNIRLRLSVKVKFIFTKKYPIIFENYNVTPLDIYNGLSQVYCIKPDPVTRRKNLLA